MQKVKRLLCCNLKRKRKFFSACSWLRTDTICSCNLKWRAVWRAWKSEGDTASLCGTNSGPKCLPLPRCQSILCPTTEHGWSSALLPTAYAQSEEVADSLEGGPAESGQTWASPMALSDLSWQCSICKLMFLSWVWFWRIFSIIHAQGMNKKHFSLPPLK